MIHSQDQNNDQKKKMFLLLASFCHCHLVLCFHLISLCCFVFEKTPIFYKKHIFEVALFESIFLNLVCYIHSSISVLTQVTTFKAPFWCNWIEQMNAYHKQTYKNVIIKPFSLLVQLWLILLQINFEASTHEEDWFKIITKSRLDFFFCKGSKQRLKCC